jgi:hypothetical protein
MVYVCFMVGGMNFLKCLEMYTNSCKYLGDQIDLQVLRVAKNVLIILTTTTAKVSHHRPTIVGTKTA